MKLVKDFGVRALLATIALGSYELLLLLVAILVPFDFKDAILLLSAGQAPAMLALGFYFGQRSNGAPNQ